MLHPLSVLTVWIHMYAHEYICCFTKYEYFMYFLVSRFFTRFFAGSGPVSGSVHILGFAGSMTGPVPITLLLSLGRQLMV